MLVLVYLITFRSRSSRRRNLHMRRYVNIPTGTIIAATMFIHLRSKGRVCALTASTGYWLMRCITCLSRVFDRSRITFSSLSLMASMSWSSSYLKNTLIKFGNDFRLCLREYSITSPFIWSSVSLSCL